jgi:hypothetical protein
LQSILRNGFDALSVKIHDEERLGNKGRSHRPRRAR